MNCEGFEQFVLELRHAPSSPQSLGLMEAGAGEVALDHAQHCRRCADRLAGERTLSAGLEMLAAKDAWKEAPARVETALLTAFRAQTKPQSLQFVRWPRWALAAAAAILLAMGFVVFRSMRPSNTEQKVTVRGMGATPSPTATVPDLPQTPLPPPAATAQVAAHRDHHLVVKGGSGKGGGRTAAPFLIRDSITAYGGDSEVVTDFVPVSYGDDQAPIESGQLIRVQMPRTALAKFGLPVDVERANELVKADLLVGEDGLARKIRFVR